MSVEDKQNLQKLREINSDKLIQIQHEEDSKLASQPEQSSTLHLNGEIIKEDKHEHKHSHGYSHGHEKNEHGHGHEHGESCKHKHSHGHGKGKGGKPKKNYAIIFYCIFTCLSCLYLETQELNPFLGDSKSTFMSYFCVFNVFMCLWSYFQTIRISSQVKKLSLKEHTPYPKLQLKQCDRCNFIKAPRVSHCSQCGFCIYKLDHHCMWTQTCIGYCNQRPFYLFTMYMTFGVLQFWYSTARVASTLSDQCKFFGVFEPGVYILWAITCISAGLVGLMIVMLWLGHTIMIMTNFTTLDSIKTKRTCPIPLIQVRKGYYKTDNVNPFDRGQVQNIKSLFGDCILTWWLPFGRQIENDFIFEHMNPAVITSNEVTQIKKTNLADIGKRMEGKSIKINDQETVHYEELKH